MPIDFGIQSFRAIESAIQQKIGGSSIGEIDIVNWVMMGEWLERMGLGGAPSVEGVDPGVGRKVSFELVL